MTIEAFMRPHIQAAEDRYSVHVVTSGATENWIRRIGVHAVPHDLSIPRQIDPLADLKALASLARLFRQERFQLVHSITPKAGLLAAVAAATCRVPVRLHTFTGQIWATRHGVSRWFFKCLDKSVARLNTLSLVDSPSQREFLIKEGVLTERRSIVLGAGSICGVDPSRFRPDLETRRRIRAEAGISDGEVLFLYLGRLRREKGVLDLAAAFRKLASTQPGSRLALIGPDEDGLCPEVNNILGPLAHQVIRSPWTSFPEHWCAAADVLCIPSYREGFGMTAIEAAACGVPAVASRIYGLIDAVVPGSTGLLHEPADVQSLADAMELLVRSPSLRRSLGEAARIRVIDQFSTTKVAGLMMNLYARILQRGGEK